MLILAIDTTSVCASVAIIEDGHMHGEFTLNHPKTHSQKVMPMLEALLKESGFKLTDMDAIAVANGPGSFTGIRIGLSTAKGLAQPFGTKVYEVSSLLGLAYNLEGSDALLCPLMDARRDEVYTALYTFEATEDGMRIKHLLPEQGIHPLKWGEAVAQVQAETGKRVIFLGDGARKYGETVGSAMAPGTWSIAAPHLLMQRAASIGTAALYGEGVLREHDAIDANYLRKSEAEETREAKNAKLAKDASQKHD